MRQDRKLTRQFGVFDFSRDFRRVDVISVRGVPFKDEVDEKDLTPQSRYSLIP